MICVSEELRQALWWRKSLATVIPDGVDLGLFSPGPQEAARKELGWERSHPVALLNVRDDPAAKGLDLAKAAMQIVRVRIPEAELRVIENVEPDRMPLLYRASDALLCLSLSEGSPNVVKEALACNLPVISTPVGDVRERLAGVHPSAVVERNAEAIGDALVQVLLTRTRSNGRERIAPLCLENTARNVAEVYRTALGARPQDNPEASGVGVEPVSVVSITDGDMVRKVATLHLEAFAGYLNTLLGYGYAKDLVQWFMNSERAIALALIDGNRRTLGYALGAPVGYTKEMNRELFWGVVAQLTIRPWLLLNRQLWAVFLDRVTSEMGLSQISRPTVDLPQPSMSLVAIGVARLERNRGAGQRLMQAFEAKAREFGMRSLVLSAYANREEVCRFYEKSGWHLCDVQADKAGVVRFAKILQPDPTSPGQLYHRELQSALTQTGH